MTQHHAQHGHAQHGHAQHDHAQHDHTLLADSRGLAALGDLLDLDGVVLQDYLSEVTGWLQQEAADLPRHCIVDLGAGTGTGTVALAQRFADAEVIAVDLSEQMLHRVTAKAVELGIGDRIRTVPADLAAGWPAIGSADLIWASNCLHEMADPDRIFAAIASALSPGGVLAVAEMDAVPRFLPDDIGLGRPGLESRWLAAVSSSRREGQPQLGPDWGSQLQWAGFTRVMVRQFVIDLQPPHASPVGAYAHAYLRRIRPVLDSAMSADDLATIDVLLDGSAAEGLLHRGDLRVRNSRTIWLARLR